MAETADMLATLDAAAPALGDRRRRTRLRIVKGAAQAFGEYGFEATTIPDILAAAAVSRRTFYQYFPDKTALLLVIYERSTQHLLEARRRAMQGPGSGRERLRRGQQVYFDFIASSGPLIGVLAAEALRPGGPLMPRRLWLHQAIESLFCEAFSEAEGCELDPLAVRALILSTEALILHVQLHCQADPALLARAQRLLSQQLDAMTTTRDHHD